MDKIQSLYPSQDGNEHQRFYILDNLNKLLTGIDQLKDPSKLILGKGNFHQGNYSLEMNSYSEIPTQGIPITETIDHLLELSNGHRYVNSNYVANAAPLPNIASVLGNLLMTLLNGNNIWDVESLTASKLEAALTEMLSRVVGYDEALSGGYTTWGGQGAVFNSLRIAITKHFPQTNEVGIPPNLYCFCSELSHYSLYKSVEATGIGTNNLVKIRTNPDHSMDIEDLIIKMEQVIEIGGIPIYILATMGSTDSFAIDDLEKIKETAHYFEKKNGLAPIYIHADTAMGGMFTFFNNYNFEENPLFFEKETLENLKNYHKYFSSIHLADSMVFDFHKLGQTPYASSLFLIKKAENFRFVDLETEETPYVGKREYGKYHTSYTLECSRMGSSIPIYASLLTLGIEGYQKILANYLQVNLEFRKQLTKAFKYVAVTNQVSPVTTFRFYPKNILWEKEQLGMLDSNQINEINQFNASFGEKLGMERHRIYFGNTSRQCIIDTIDNLRIPVYAHKFFSISPYTTIDIVPKYIDFLKEQMEVFLQNQYSLLGK
ncbi:MAG: pyridoxal-dependent decarboxylase [Bacillota bacterium]|nr:pyridoxal-dependent decarboxylase [Bacillota bacterium]